MSLMKTAYVIDYYDEIDGGHYLRTASNLLYLLTFVSSLHFTWNICKCECVDGLFSAGRVAFLPQKLVARSATYQGV